ncbi:ABC transporter permease [Vibrio viridaestus]|uniref:Transport permease protein n=1 Tax=Vibrio viridaestus TaxID=2487322 RepID=A0A3N9TBY6_9VIBR|nr:ABC transporter permease [Vibrio viridaestus]RQW61718.1 ABC transporter permease [Vibrio viridaestus]
MKFMHTINLILVKASLNLKSEASVNYLSYTWWVIEPLMHMSVYYLVFAFFLQRGDENYVVFLLTGLIPWLWFSKTVNHAMGSIIQGRFLMNQLFIHKIFFPMTFIIQDALKQIIVFLILVLFLIAYGIDINTEWIYLLLIIAIQFIFTTACSLLAALITPFIRDMSYIIPTTLQFLMFTSGIFFNYKDIPVQYQSYLFFNPIAVLLACYRDVLLDNNIAHLYELISVGGVGVLLILVSIVLYRKLEYKLPRVVLE